ncbi:MAG: hypothetical protein LBD91_05465 [Prevotellaceae bacterium]|jgi:hypothetical protein|nr:hypothetical protein [Prevotellaceae bacterium]
MKQLKEETQGLYSAIKDGTATEEMKKRFHEATQEASELQKTIEGVRARITMLASNTAVMQSIVDSLGLVNAGFEITQGVLVEIGMESAAVNNVMNKLNAAYVVANGLQSISNALKQKSALMTALESAATPKNIAIKTIAIATQKALNAAQANMPILALVAGQSLLIGWLGKYALSASKLSKEQQLINDIQAKSVELYAEKMSVCIAFKICIFAAANSLSAG